MGMFVVFRRNSLASSVYGNGVEAGIFDDTFDRFDSSISLPVYLLLAVLTLLLDISVVIISIAVSVSS